MSKPFPIRVGKNAEKILRRHGAVTLDRIADLSMLDLLGTKGCGTLTMQEIEGALKKAGRTLRSESTARKFPPSSEDPKPEYTSADLVLAQMQEEEGEYVVSLRSGVTFTCTRALQVGNWLILDEASMFGPGQWAVGAKPSESQKFDQGVDVALSEVAWMANSPKAWTLADVARLQRDLEQMRKEQAGNQR